MYQDDCLKNNRSMEANQDVKIGVIIKCAKLNVREKPSLDAAIVCVVPRQTELMIDKTESTYDFYKVCTAAGIEGFCMREFVSV